MYGPDMTNLLITETVYIALSSLMYDPVICMLAYIHAGNKMAGFWRGIPP